MNFSKTKITKCVIYGCAIVPVLAMMICVLIYSPVYCDSAYYLSISSLISKGWHLYKDVECGYTPLFIWTLAIINKLFHFSTHYSLWVAIQLLLSIGLSYVVYTLSKEFTSKKGIQLFTAWLTIVALLRSEGFQILLELPSVLLGLLLSIVFIKFKFAKPWIYILAGLVASLPFWCKQYGAGFIILYPILIFTNNKDKKIFTRVLLYLLGVSIPFIACYLLYPECWAALYNGYGLNNNANEFFVQQKIHSILWAIKYFIFRYFPLLLLIILPLFCKNNKPLSIKNKSLLLFCIIGLFGFAFQFFFSTSNHYFIFMVPFAAILCSFICDFAVNETNKSIKYIFAIVLVFNVCTLLNSTFRNTLYKDYFKGYILNKTRQEQINNSARLSNILQENNCEFCFCKDHSIMYLNYYSNLIAPNDNNKACYSFGILAYNEDEYSSSIDRCDAVVNTFNSEPILQLLIDNKCASWEKEVLSTSCGPIKVYIQQSNPN